MTRHCFTMIAILAGFCCAIQAYAEVDSMTLNAPPWHYMLGEGARAVAEPREKPNDTVATAVLMTVEERVLVVAPNGNDMASGSHADPFATPHAARNAARELRAAGHEGPIAIELIGRHFAPGGLALTHEDSGRVDAPTVWRSAPDSHAEIVGGVLLHAWEDEGDGIWSAAYPTDLDIGEIFVNGHPLTRARIPKEGYLKVEGPVEGREHTAFHFTEGDFTAEVDFKGARVFIWAGVDWFSQTIPVASVDAEQRIITLDERTGYDLRPGNRYRLENARAFLTEPGEYTLDTEERRVFLRQTGGGPPSAGSVTASTARNVLTITGEAELPIQHVRFENLAFTTSVEHAVRITHGNHITLDGCRIEHSGGAGIHIEGPARHATIERCEIRRFGSHGVVMQGLPPGQADVNGHHTIHNNHIHHGGRLVGDGCGVYISQSVHNAITHNEIHHMPRYGTSIKGTRYQLLREEVEGVTWENRHDFLHSRNNRIAFNRIHHVNLDSRDTGAMESWGPGRDNVYDHNLIHDIGNDFSYLHMGVYLDDGSDYFTVTNNIIFGVRGTHMIYAIYAKGVGNRLENNIFVLTPPMYSALASYFMADERTDSHVYRRNIFYFDGVAPMMHFFFNRSDDRVAESDYNLYWHTGGEAPMLGDGGDANIKVWTYDEWRSLFEGRYDANSVIADPLFMDPANRDYRLKPGSPAYALGFTPIETDRIGLRDDFPARFREDALGAYPRRTRP